jgi:hypothetical protein
LFYYEFLVENITGSVHIYVLKIDCIISNTLPIEFDSGLTERQVDVLYELQTEMTILL